VDSSPALLVTQGEGKAKQTGQGGDEDDDDDLVGEMLFLAKKHRISLPTETPSSSLTGNDSESEDIEGCFSYRPTRLPQKRFGIFR
jgi:hypothetical protein